MSIVEQYKFLGTAFDQFIDKQYSGMDVPDDPTQPVKFSDKVKDVSKYIQIYVKERIVFIDYQWMLMNFPRVKVSYDKKPLVLDKSRIKDRSAIDMLEESFSNSDVSEVLKWFELLLNEKNHFSALKNGEDWQFELRFYNYHKSNRMTEITSDVRGLLTTIKGIPIVRGREVAGQPKEIEYECNECGTTKIVLLKQGQKVTKYKKQCLTLIGDSDDSSGKSFYCRSRNYTRKGIRKYQNMFNIQVEALVEETPNKLEPTVFHMELVDNLCQEVFLNQITLGMPYKFTGIIKMRDVSSRDGTPRHIPYMEVMQFDEIREKRFEQDITDEERVDILKFLAEKDSLNKATDMFGTRVVGYKREKMFFILSKLNQERFNNTNKRKPKEYIMHGLVVGNYARGKSELADIMQEICDNPYYVIGSATTGVGLCVSSDSIVYTDKGRMTIKKLVDGFAGQDVKVWTLDKEGKGNFKKIEEFYKIEDENKNRMKIKTALGYKIITTMNTGLMTRFGWKKAMDVKEGDRIMTALNYDFDYRETLSFELFLPDQAYIKDKKLIEFAHQSIGEKRSFAKENNISEDKIYYTHKKHGMSFKDYKKFPVKYSLPKKLDVYGSNGHSVTKVDLEDPELYYYLGIIFGDGNIHFTDVRFYNTDIELLSFFEKYSKKIGLNVRKEKNKGIDMYSSGSTTLVALLKYLGMKGHKNNLKLNLPFNKEQNKLFLRGLFDTDGCVEKKRGRVSVSMVSRQFAKDVQERLLFFGIRSTLRKRKGKEVEFPNGKTYLCNDKYEITIMSKYVKIFHDKINFGIKRKKIDLKNTLRKYKPINYQNQGYWDKIIKIERFDEKTELYDLTVEKEHSYIANNILVHNTGITIRDELTGQFGIQAGVLARASGDTLIVEEFDKQRDRAEFGVLNEAMSKYEYVVTKGGKQRKFKSHTNIIVIANPEKKVFDETVSLIPQINITGDLLSRFDVISCILSPKDIQDELSINTIMLERTGEEVYKIDYENAQFIKKCIKVASEQEPNINTTEVKEYLNNFTKLAFSLAKQTFGADQDFYSNITPRHRHSLLKVIKAVAMWHLHPVPTKEDMEEAFQLMSSFWKEFVDRPKLLNMKEIEMGMTIDEIEETVEQKLSDTKWEIKVDTSRETKKGRREVVMDMIRDDQEKNGMCELNWLQKWANENLQMSRTEFDDLIKHMQTEGEVFSPRNGFIKVL